MGAEKTPKGILYFFSLVLLSRTISKQLFLSSAHHTTAKTMFSRTGMKKERGASVLHSRY
jgi:hypothetical protein